MPNPSTAHAHALLTKLSRSGSGQVKARTASSLPAKDISGLPTERGRVILDTATCRALPRAPVSARYALQELMCQIPPMRSVDRMMSTRA
jgi:hypothetical protein